MIEGKVRKGGVNQKPQVSRPTTTPPGQGEPPPMTTDTYDRPHCKDFKLTTNYTAVGNPYGVITKGDKVVWQDSPWKVHDGSAQAAGYDALQKLKAEERSRLFAGLLAFYNGVEVVCERYSQCSVDSAVKDLTEVVYKAVGDDVIDELREVLMNEQGLDL